MDANALVKQLIGELKVLRRSRGVETKEITGKLGPALRQACGIAADDGPANLRIKLRRRLTELAECLPWDLKVLAQAAFALVPDANDQFYNVRLAWAAKQIDRQERTLRRRADEAVRQLAELAAADLTGRSAGLGAEQVGDGWHTETLSAMLNLSTPEPEAFEFRTIVADRDELPEIDLAVTLTAAPNGSTSPPGALAMDVLYGGRLTQRFMEAERRFAMKLTFPEPLNAGDRHDFALRFRVADESQMRPHFVSVTRQPCDKVELRVKFDDKRVPSNVWLLSRVFQSDLGDPAQHGERVPVDAAGELRVEFLAPDPGFAYGVRWEIEPNSDSARMR
ncbi:MAG TPA: hypothetical protein VJ914_02280 [Pseudonocardiaceae bacterium]|nr:hypothetical protein [Pseudonocardiaceae bacterium]